MSLVQAKADPKEISVSAFYVTHLLQGRRFLITGATGGAGSRTAIEISRCGGICKLMVRDAAKGEKVLRDLHGSGHSLHVMTDPFTMPVEVFDGIFHTSGEESIGALFQQTEPLAREVMMSSFGWGVEILACVGRRNGSSLKDGGSIVFMSSVAATHGQTGMSLYCASKGAIESLVRAAAVELAPRRIRVNAIRAGAFASPMHTRITQRSTPEAVDAYAQKHLLGFGRAEDIANAALFLLADTSKWVTGSIFSVDGGYGCK